MSENLKSYAYARDLMDSALMSNKGIAVTFPTVTEARRVRFDCYYARKRDIAASKEVYSPDTPEYGNSPYNELRFCIVGSVLKIEPQHLTPLGELKIVEL